jgi:N-dimethylarginine dimethylaminohydrolase
LVVDRLEVRFNEASKELDDLEEEVTSLFEKAALAQAKAVQAQAKMTRKRKEWRRLRAKFHEAINHADSILMDEDIRREAAEAAAGVEQGAWIAQWESPGVEIDPVAYQALLAQMGA